MRWLQHGEKLMGPDWEPENIRGQVYRAVEGGQDTYVKSVGTGGKQLWMTPQVIHADPRRGPRGVSTAVSDPSVEKGCDFYVAKEIWDNKKNEWVDIEPPKFLARTSHAEYLLADEFASGRKALWVN